MKVFAAIGMLMVLVAGAGFDPAVGPAAPENREVAFRSTVNGVTAAGVPNTWRPGCPVGPSELRAITVDHWGFDGAVHQGVLIVNRDAVAAMVAVFHRLYDIGFPIHRMEPVDRYRGSDDASMGADNSSAFNCRARTGSTTVWSEHSYGRAVDLNPVENPYVMGAAVAPDAGRPYRDRGAQGTGMIHADDAVVEAFAAVGWSWGGKWRSPTDYQHFSSSGR